MQNFALLRYRYRKCFSWYSQKPRKASPGQKPLPSLCDLRSVQIFSKYHPDFFTICHTQCSLSIMRAVKKSQLKRSPLDFSKALKSFMGYLEGTQKAAHTIKNY